jgi:hypothetical protein
MKTATIVGILLIILGIVGFAVGEPPLPSGKGRGHGSRSTLAQANQNGAYLSDFE